MGKISSFFLAIHGFFVYKFSKLNHVALGKYKTKLFKKYNPGINHIGGATYWNNIKNIKIGKGSYINGADLITIGDSKIYIGENCLISYDVVI